MPHGEHAHHAHHGHTSHQESNGQETGPPSISTTPTLSFLHLLPRALSNWTGYIGQVAYGAAGTPVLQWSGSSRSIIHQDD